MGGVNESAKARLRRELASRRRTLAPRDVTSGSIAVSGYVTAAPLFERAQHLVVYAARPDELDVSALGKVALSRGTPLYYPRVEPMGLTFRRSTPLDLVAGAFGIAEPRGDAPELSSEAPGVLFLVPGLAFDRSGARLGFGRGLYDRALSRHPASRRIGVALERFVLEAIPVDPWDVPMDALVTEQGFLTAGEGAGVHPGDVSWT